MHEEDEGCRQVIREIDKILKERGDKLSDEENYKLCRMRNDCVFYLEYGVWFSDH